MHRRAYCRRRRGCWFWNHYHFNKGRMAFQKLMNFRENSKRSLLPPFPLFFENLIVNFCEKYCLFSVCRDCCVFYVIRVGYFPPPPLFWNLSENSSVLESPSFPKGGRRGTASGLQSKLGCERCGGDGSAQETGWPGTANHLYWKACIPHMVSRKVGTNLEHSFGITKDWVSVCFGQS